MEPIKETFYLLIHFAPSTACVAVEITGSVAAKMIDAIAKHGNNKVTMEIIHNVKASLILEHTP